MSKDKLIFLPVTTEDNLEIDYKLNGKTMVMIKTRINGYEQTVQIPLKQK